MDTTIGITWNYYVDKDATPSSNVIRLLNTLSFKSLEFITEDSFTRDSDLYHLPYIVNSVSMIGDVPHVKMRLHESIEALKTELEIYINSEESFDDKVYELSIAKLYIKEFFLKNSLHDPVLLDINFTFNLINFNLKDIITVRYDECQISTKASKEIHAHQHLRHSYIKHLEAFIDVFKEKLHLSVLNNKREKVPANTEREFELLEVWIALKESGFMDHLKDKNAISEHRKEFFELFQLTDINYSSKNRVIKERKPSSARFLPELVTLLNKYHKKKE